MEELSEILNLFPKISDQARKDFTKCIYEKKFNKGTLLLKQGEICKYIYFLKEGFARGFYYHEGKEFTLWFGLENDIITSMYSFVSQKNSFESIEFLENSIVYCLEYEQLQRLYKQHIEINLIGRLFTEKYYIKLEERVMSLQFQSALERYNQIIKNKPNLLQRASLGHIASYLGITQETLSRIRSKT